MSLSSPFIHRRVATSLLTAAVALAGALAYRFLPVSPLPQVEFPTIRVQAALPGASPETMASSVATPLERQFGRIAGVAEMTSESILGSTTVTMQFDLDRNIDAAARDVQAAINAARGQLPANLPTNPNYRKVNPADAPIIIVALTSERHTAARMYDAAASVLQQRISQLEGVGQVNVSGGSLPAVRVDVNPDRLHLLGLTLADVRTTIARANLNRPKGALSGPDRTWEIAANDQLRQAKDYGPLVLAQRDGAPIRLSDVADVVDGVEDVRNRGFTDGEPSVLLVVFRQPGANIIETVDRVRAALPGLQAEIPAGMRMTVVVDRSTTIRASVADVQGTLLLSIALVILVVFVFLRDVRTTLIPSVAVPVSLIGTFGVMWWLGYSIDNLSLMALTIATGFVVDDAIVVSENVTRHLEQGMKPLPAALLGAKEIGFTVLSMSTSLVAVFIPILLMGGIVGRLFREFAVTLSVSIGVSMVVSLTTTPMMCAALLKSRGEVAHGRVYAAGEAVFDRVQGGYRTALDWVLRHQPLTLAVTIATIALSVYLYRIVPKGFFPQQDTGRLTGNMRADQDSSSGVTASRLQDFSRVLLADPAVDGVVAFTGGDRGTTNVGTVFVRLKALGQRKLSADEVIGRLRGKLAEVPGASLYLQPVQDLRVGGMVSAAQYQFTLQAESLDELSEWAPKVLQRVRGIPGLVDVNSNQQNGGLLASVEIDRPTAARFGITPQAIDDVLYDAFGQRQVSTIYTSLNQYHVVLELAPRFGLNPDSLSLLYVRARDGGLVPLSAICRFGRAKNPLTVSHSGPFPAATISFNLLPGASLGDAVEKIGEAQREMGLPATIRGRFSGAAQAFESSLANMPLLILAALLAVYIVLGILYESLVHPLTILSTLPSAGVGALVALLWFQMDLSVIAFIGIILLIGIVKKNAIMMVDFAVDAERSRGLSPVEAIREACRLRFRPILMTTMAALLGGLPLALGTGVGSELRRPLGIAIVGGLIVSQLLTLFTTPVVYLYLDRMRLRFAGRRRPAHDSSPVPLVEAARS